MPFTLFSLFNPSYFTCSVAIAFFLTISGILILTAAVEEFKRGLEELEVVSLLIGLSFTSILIFGFLTVVKLHYSTKLNSPSLRLDGFCSFIGMVLSFSLFMVTVIEAAEPSTWWFDPFIATVVGILSMLVGLRFLCRTACVHGMPIWSLSWWTAVQDGELSVPGPKNETEMSAVVDDDEEDDNDIV